MFYLFINQKGVKSNNLKVSFSPKTKYISHILAARETKIICIFEWIYDLNDYQLIDYFSSS